MNKKEFSIILQEGETHDIEFKESISNLDKEIVAFSNSSGGRIFLGVSDDGSVKGMDITNKLKSQIQDIASNCQPKIKVDINHYENVLIINVPEGKDKPYMCKQGFYIRIGPNSQKSSRDDILKLAIKDGKLRYDESIDPDFDFEKDFNENKFSEFLKDAKITANLPHKDILVNMNLAEKQGSKYCFKNAVHLFFSKEIKKFNTSAYTTCILFKGDTRTNIIDRKDFDGNIIEQVEDAVRFVEKNIMTAYQIKSLKRKEIQQYPIEAIREAIVNAVMHRDYFEKGSNVFIYIYDNFIEIVNPGGLFGITKDQLGKVCVRRNERIADLFKMLDLVEKAGTGIQRMKDAMKKAELKEPKIEISDNFFMITFFGHRKDKLGDMSEGKNTVELNQRQIQFVKRLEEKEELTRTDYETITKSSKRTAIRDLNELVAKKIVAVISTSETDPNKKYKLM